MICKSCEQSIHSYDRQCCPTEQKYLYWPKTHVNSQGLTPSGLECGHCFGTRRKLQFRNFKSCEELIDARAKDKALDSEFYDLRGALVRCDKAVSAEKEYVEERDSAYDEEYETVTAKLLTVGAHYNSTSHLDIIVIR